MLDNQSWCNECIAPPEYKIEEWTWGSQPWDMSSYIPKEKYEAVYQFGFQHFPDRPLPNWYLYECGFDDVTPEFLGIFKGPNLRVGNLIEAKNAPNLYTLDEPYVIVAPRGDLTTDMFGRSIKDCMYDFAAKCPVQIVQIGGKGEAWPWENSIDITGLDWYETCTWVERAKGFYGLISSQAALALSFEIPKVFIHNGRGWDMRHVVRTSMTKYLVMPTAEQVLDFMRLR